MQRVNLALLGREITHSLSPAVYKNLIPNKLAKYFLFDCVDYSSIGNVQDLFLCRDLRGLSITTPYKPWASYWVDEYSSEFEFVGPVNTIKLEGAKVLGTNTDLIALDLIFKKYFLEEDYQVVVLGDGSIASMIVWLMNEYEVECEQYSRRLGSLQSVKSSEILPSLFINCCSRSYVPQFQMKKSDIFWDLNYSNPAVQRRVENQTPLYYDGREMLVEQAKAALQFWDIDT